MDYLSKYNITKEMLEELKKSLDSSHINYLELYEDKITKILDYLISVGINNVYDILMHRINIFYEDIDYIKKSIESNNNIVELINEDIVNFEDIGL